MNKSEPLSPYERALKDLKHCGIKLERLPGEYRLSHLSGSESTARYAESLEDALKEGHEMANQHWSQSVFSPKYPVPLTFKARRRLKILAHNHKARAIWLKKRGKTS